MPFCRFSDGLWSVDCQQTLFHHVFNHAHHASGDGVGYLLVDFVADAVGQIVAQPLIGFFAAAEQAAEEAFDQAGLFFFCGGGGILLRRGGVLRRGGGGLRLLGNLTDRKSVV